MTPKVRIAFVIRFAARIWSAVIFVILAVMLIEHTRGLSLDEIGNFPLAFNSRIEMFSFLLFPVGTVIGLVIAWIKEGLGGSLLIICMLALFFLRPDLASSPHFLMVAILGALFLLYSLLMIGVRVKYAKTGSRIRMNRNDIAIGLVISCLPALGVMWSMHSNADRSFTKTELNNASERKIENVYIHLEIDNELMGVFAHSLQHSMQSGFELNGIEAHICVGSDETNGAWLKSELDHSSSDSLHVQIEPLYKTREDGYEAIIGTIFTVRLDNAQASESIWRATGQVDYVVMFPANYEASDDMRKEFAWHTTAQIVNAFVAEINKQEPKLIHTVTEARQKFGQRID